MSMKLFFAPYSSASPVVWALAELGVSHEAVQLDLQSGDHKTPDLLQHNPMGQVPTLVDQDQGMFESSAIIVYLGERYGVKAGLWPEVGSPQHMMALSWNTWFAVTMGAAMRQVMNNTKDWFPPEMKNEGQAKVGRKRVGALMKILDDRLGQQPYIVAESFTLVDAYASAAMRWCTGEIEFDIATTPHVAAWIDRCFEREGAKRMV